MKNLQVFVGKVCTVFTLPTNRNFKEEDPNGEWLNQVMHYFLGLVEYINEDGIMLKQLTSNRKTFIFMSGIISISEEEVTKVEEKKVETKLPEPKINAIKTSESKFIDPESIEQLVIDARNKAANI